VEVYPEKEQNIHRAGDGVQLTCQLSAQGKVMDGSNWECSLSAVKERSFRANHSSRLMT